MKKTIYDIFVQVKSHSKPWLTHTVVRVKNIQEWACDCEDFIQRRKFLFGETCIHIDDVTCALTPYIL